MHDDNVCHCLREDSTEWTLKHVWHTCKANVVMLGCFGIFAALCCGCMLGRRRRGKQKKSTRSPRYTIFVIAFAARKCSIRRIATRAFRPGKDDKVLKV